MIYTLGYWGVPVAGLRRVAECLDATIVDVRGTPYSRRREMNRRPLEAALGARYEWWGDRLGNHGANRVTDRGLADLAGRPGNAILICMEKPPGDCHRHHQIAMPLLRVGIDAVHIYEDELIRASELARAIAADDDYCVVDPLELGLDSSMFIDAAKSSPLT